MQALDLIKKERVAFWGAISNVIALGSVVYPVLQPRTEVFDEIMRGKTTSVGGKKTS